MESLGPFDTTDTTDTQEPAGGSLITGGVAAPLTPPQSPLGPRPARGAGSSIGPVNPWGRGGSPFDTADTKLDQAARLGSQTPAAAAGVTLRLHRQTGMPVDVIHRNIEQVQTDEQRRAMADLRQNYPGVAQWISEQPFHASVAVPDLASFKAIEGAATALRMGWQGGRLQSRIAEEDFSNLMAPGSANIGYDSRESRRTAANASPLNPTRFQDILFNTGKLVGQMVPGFPETATGALTGAVAGLGVAAAAAAAGVTAPVTVPAAAAVGAVASMFNYTARQEAGSAYQGLGEIRGTNGEIIPEDVKRPAAFAVGALNGAIELALDIPIFAPFKAAARRFSANIATDLLARPTMRKAMATFGEHYLTALVSEPTQEVAQELTNVVAEEFAKQVSQGNFETLMNSPEQREAAITRLSDIAEQTVKGTLLLAGVGPSVRMGTDILAARKATQRADYFVALGEALDKASGPAKESGGATEVAARALGNASFYVDPEPFTEYFQKAGVDPREAAREIWGSSKPYDDAVLAGHAIEIPSRLYAEKIAPTEANSFFAKELRLGSPGVMNAREGKKFAADIATEHERRTAELGDAAKVAEERQGLVDHFTQQLSATGVYRAQDAATMAEPLAAFVRVMARRTGQTHDEFMAAHPLSIVGPEGGVSQAADALYQEETPTPGMSLQVAGQAANFWIGPRAALLEYAREHPEKMNTPEGWAAFVAEKTTITPDDAAQMVALFESRATHAPNTLEGRILSAPTAIAALAHGPPPKTFVSRLRSAIEDRTTFGKKWDEPRPAADWIGKLQGMNAFSKAEANLLLPLLKDAQASKNKLARSDVLALADTTLPSSNVVRTFLSAGGESQGGEVTDIGDVDLTDPEAISDAIAEREEKIEELGSEIERELETARSNAEGSGEQVRRYARDVVKVLADAGIPEDRAEKILEPAYDYIHERTSEDESADADEAVKGENRRNHYGYGTGGRRTYDGIVSDISDELDTETLLINARYTIRAVRPVEVTVTTPDPGSLFGHRTDTEPLSASEDDTADSIRASVAARRGVPIENVAVGELPEMLYVVLGPNNTEVARSTERYEVMLEVEENENVRDDALDSIVTDLISEFYHYINAVGEDSRDQRVIYDLEEGETDETRQRDELGEEIDALRHALIRAQAAAPIALLPSVEAGPSEEIVTHKPFARAKYGSLQLIADPAAHGGREVLVALPGLGYGDKWGKNHYADTQEDVIAHYRARIHPVLAMPGVGAWVEDVEGETSEQRAWRAKLRAERVAREGLEQQRREIERQLEAMERDMAPGAGPPEGARMLVGEWRRLDASIATAATREATIAAELTPHDAKAVDAFVVAEFQSDYAQDAGRYGVQGVSDTPEVGRALDEQMESLYARLSVLRAEPATLVHEADRVDSLFRATQRAKAAIESGKAVPGSAFLSGGARFDPSSGDNGRWDVDGSLTTRAAAGAALLEAAEGGYEQFAWSDAANRHVMASLPLAAATITYDKIAKSAVIDVMRRAGFSVEPEHIYIAGHGHWSIPLTHEMRVAIKQQGVALLQESESNMPRGSIRLSTTGGAVIQLNPNANLSTFLHETGHFYLDVMGSLAADHPEIAADYALLLEHIGATPGQPITRELHEIAARSLEAYVMEGKAPSVGLRRVFSRFKTWLLALYRSVKGLNVTLSDEVRGVFDRMLATDEEIAQARERAGVAPIFADAKEAGMTDEQFAAYQQTIADANTDENDTLRAKVLGQYMRERDLWWKTARREVRADVESEVNEQQVYATLLALQKRVAADGTPIARLNRDEIRALMGEDFLARSRGLRIWQAKDGLSITQAAEQFGYDSPDAMLKALVAAPPRTQTIETATDQRMAAKYGDMLSDGSLAAQADAAVLGEKADAVIRAEMRALLSLHRQIGAKDEAQAEGARRSTGHATVTAGIPDPAYVSDLARQRLELLRVRDLRPFVYWTAARRASKAALEAMGKGDYAAALNAKQSELLNNELYRQAVTLGEESDTIHEYARSLQTARKQSALGKAGAIYLDQVTSLLERFDFATITNRESDSRASVMAFIAKMKELGLPVNIPDDIQDAAYRKPWREMTIDELRGVYDTLKHVDHLSRLKNKLLKSEAKRELDEARGSVAGSIIDNAKRTLPPNAETTLPTQGRAVRAIQGFVAAHRKLASYIRQMDGFMDGGPIWELVMRPLNEASDRQSTLNADATTRLAEIFDRHYSKAETAALYKKQAISAKLGSLSRMGRLMMALNWGTEDNQQKLVAGLRLSLGAEIDETDVAQALNTLDARDWAFVQDVWMFIGSYWPEIKTLAERLDGVAPEKVEGVTVNTRFGAVQGAYFPLKYDRSQSTLAHHATIAVSADEVRSGSAVRASTKAGARNARVGGVQSPLRLDFGVIREHLNELSQDLTHTETLIDVGRIMTGSAVRDAIRSHYGNHVYQNMMDSIEAIAAGTLPPQNAWESALGFIRSGTTVAGLGWNVVTSALQPLGLSNSMVRVGPTWIAKGIAEWIGDAAHMENTATWITSKSTMMQHRTTTQMRELSELMHSIGFNQGFVQALADQGIDKATLGKYDLNDLQQSYFWFITRMQLVADIPTWLGAYRKALAAMPLDEIDDAHAVALADQAVLDSQSGGALKDLAAVQRGGALAKIWTTFYSYMNLAWNQNVEAVERADFRSAKSIGRLAVDLLLLDVVPVILGYELRKVLRGGDDDDWETRLLAWAREVGGFATGMLLGLREISGVINGFQGYEGPTGARFFASLGKLLQQGAQGESDRALWSSLNAVAGTLLHYPAGQVQRTVDGLAALATGRTHNWLAPLVGVGAK